ncbi:hypothetical protein FJT64_003544 [Amphibalanus amphitrite]|uniref:Uncharacterized protein n=1 Tax=Amphibalanus amphitrite TaxID=1232801 RepID=A0A6A4WBA2_AMPAM|nr:hypothetical protein FJT64_003544 [Amphibalanus amphitrite]
MSRSLLPLPLLLLVVALLGLAAVASGCVGGGGGNTGPAAMHAAQSSLNNQYGVGGGLRPPAAGGRVWESRDGSTKENRLQGLVSLLQDGALDYFASLSEDVQGNLQQTVAALEARFGTAKNAMQAHAELASIRQQPGEATRDFADRVRQTGREAYPGAAAGDPAVEATVVSRFVDGLREEQLRVRVLTKDPASLIEAVKAADKFERQQDALRAMRPPSEGEALAVQDWDAPGTARLDALERIIGELQRALQALETAGRRDAYRTGHGTGARNPQRGPPNPNRRGFDKWRHRPAPVASRMGPVESDASGASRCGGGQPSSDCVEVTVTSNGSESESVSREGGSPSIGIAGQSDRQTAQASGEVISAGDVAGEEARTTSRPGVDGDAGDASPVEWSGTQKAQEESPPRNHARQLLSHQTPCNTSKPEEWSRALDSGDQ